MNNTHQQSSLKQIGRAQKLFVSCSVFFLFFGATYPLVSAEVDSTVLMNILSQIAGTGVTVGTGTTENSTGGSATTTTPPVTSSTETDHLSISANSSGKIGESLDITIKALTKNGGVATGYRGTIFVSVDDDYKATVPYPDGYSFTSQDQGVKTFSKGLSFSKAGTFKVSVSDFAQAKIIGSTSIKISAAETKASPVIETVKPGNTPVNTGAIVQTGATTTKSLPKTTPSFKILKVEIGDKKATITFQVQNDTPDIQKFAFLYADSEGNSKKVITSAKEGFKKANGDYVWYIPDLKLTKYTMSISGIDKNGEDVAGAVSQPFEANLSLLSAGKCIIPNVSGLRVLSKKDSSILYWDSIPEAVVYKIYKKNANGDYVFLEETKQDSYTVHVSDGSVKYEDFSVKAVCSDGTESVAFAPTTSVRTGPKEIIILLALSALIGFFVVKRRKNLG